MAHAACADHNPMAADVPLCPDNGNTLLGEKYPAKAVVLSEPGLSASSFVMNRNEIKKYVSVQALAILQAQAKKPPQLFIHAGSATREEILNKIKMSDVDESTKAKWRDSIIFIDPPTILHSTAWQQDIFESFADIKTGQPVLRAVDYEQYAGRKSFENLSDALDPKCNITIGKPLQPGEIKKQGYHGGNLETFLDHCVVGDDSLTEVERKKYAAQFCGGESNLVYAPSFFTQVSHADELFKVVPLPSQPPPCNYAVLVSSPKKALELMQKNPTSPAFHFPANMNDNGKAGMMATESYFDVCRDFLKVSRENKSKGNDGSVLNILPQFLISSSWATNSFEKSLVMWSSLDNQRGKMDYDDALKCSRMTNSDLYQIMDKKRKVFTEHVQFHLDNFKESIATIGEKKYACPKSQAHFIDVPNLYTGYLGHSIIDKNGEEKFRPVNINSRKDLAARDVALVTGSSLNVYPNAVNSEYINGTLIMTNPMNSAFERHTAEQLSALGVKPQFLSNNNAHENFGGLHCTLHAIRYCRPRGVKK